MKKLQGKIHFQTIKKQIFSFAYILNSMVFVSKSMLLFGLIFQMTSLHMYYFNPIYQFMYNNSYLSSYFNNFYSFFIHINPFSTNTLNLLTLTIYPLVAIFVYVLKKIGNFQILKFLLQIFIFLYPALFIKHIIQIINSFTIGNFLYITIPLSIISFIFGVLILAFSQRLHRLIEIPIILIFQLKGNYYLLFAILFLRISILIWYLGKKNPFILGIMFEVGCFLVCILIKFTDDQLSNLIGYGLIMVITILFGFCMIQKYEIQRRDIYDLIDLIQEEQNEEIVFQIYKMIQLHESNCAFPSCHCHKYFSVKTQDLSKFVYQFQENRLKKKQTLQGRLQYAQKCKTRYEYKLSGLFKVYQYKPTNIWQQYKIFKTCTLYEQNLRKQDKNYRYGQPYHNVYEQYQEFNLKMIKILFMLKQFWCLINNFDGSTKFIQSILTISQQINQFKNNYEQLIARYDDEAKQFKFLYNLFQSIILNQTQAQQEQLIAPEDILFLVTNQKDIINANKNLAKLLNTSAQRIIGVPFVNYIPQIYKTPHIDWNQQFVENLDKYQNKKILKCLALNNLQIKVVQMQHRIIPRFMQGLQIFTKVIIPNQNHIDEFVVIVDKAGYFIKNIQTPFFDIVKFKINQRNFKILLQLSINSIFQNFSQVLSQNPSKQVTILSSFLQQFTYYKRQKQLIGGKSNVKTLTNILKKQLIFIYDILENSRNDDPFLKIRFKLKQTKQQKNIKQQELQQEQQSKLLFKLNDEQKQNEQNVENKKQNINFFVPYYMAGLFLGIHILYLISNNYFFRQINIINNQYLFYQAFDYTILYTLKVTVGKSQIPTLKQLWINGFGDYSQSFGVFQRASDPVFNSYFNNQITTKYQNQLYTKIYQYTQQKIDQSQYLSIILSITVLAALAHYFIDFILCIRYIFRIQSRVGQLLLLFVSMGHTEILQLQLVLDNFLSKILHIQEEKNNQIVQMPVQTVQQSALQLMRSGVMPKSLNNSLAYPDQQDSMNEKKSRSRYSSFLTSGIQGKRISLLDIKKQLKQQYTKSNYFKKQNFNQKSQIEYEKSQNIQNFRKKYQSLKFILTSNKKLFLFVTLSFLLSVGMITTIWAVLRLPMNQYSTHLSLVSNLYTSKIILLKSLQEIAINNYTLKPQITLSDNFVVSRNLINNLNIKANITDYQTLFHKLLTNITCQGSIGLQNVCTYMKDKDLMQQYGMNVMNQYIEQYFRNKDSKKIKENNNQNYIIIFTQMLLDILINSFIFTSKNYFNFFQTLEINLTIIGTFLLLIGMFFTHYSLKLYKNRIEDSEALLKIIPKQMKQKHKQNILVAQQTKRLYTNGQ